MKHIVLLIIIFCFTEIHASTYNVADFGATNDSTRLSTDSFQKAIDACHQAGGGTVIVPPGIYTISTIVLKDNVNLHLESGSVIYASRSTKDYEGLEFYAGATDIPGALAVIKAVNASGISISGTGTINCRAEREMFRREPQTVLDDSITGREIANAIKYGVDYQSKYRKVAPWPGAICFIGCENVNLRDFSVIESSGWGVHIQWCENVVIDGLSVRSSEINGVNSDGIDIDGSCNVRIANCSVDTGDDALCIKTTKGNGTPHPCKWLTITNCVLRSSSAALKIGTESYYDFSDIAISNCVINGANRGINIIVRDGATVEKIVISNMIVNTERKATFWWGNGDPLWFIVYKRGDRTSGGVIKDVMLSNILANGQSGVRIENIDGTIENITLRDFKLQMEPEAAFDKRSRDGFMFDRVRNLCLYNCDVKWDTAFPESTWRNAFRFQSVDGLRIRDITAPQAPNSREQAIQMIDTDNVDYGNSK